MTLRLRDSFSFCMSQYMSTPSSELRDTSPAQNKHTTPSRVLDACVRLLAWAVTGHTDDHAVLNRPVFAHPVE